MPEHLRDGWFVVATGGYGTSVTTLLDYAHTEFPNHTLEIWQQDGWSPPTCRTSEPPDEAGSSSAPSSDGSSAAARDAAPGVTGLTSDDMAELSLNDHTVVAHVVGAAAAISLMERLRADGWSDTAAVLVCPTPPTVFPHGNEDTESVTDLPARRVISAAVLGAVVGGLLGAAAGWIIGDEVATGLIFGGFTAVIGAVIGAMLGGLGRHAGERAWSQPNVPGRTMGVVAAFAADEAAVARVVSSMEASDPYDIRLLSATGSWRTPLT